ncbi:hypothetical protein IQ219_14160 [Synechocystis sp. LEGE 06083]|uniref:hypothetical protein n=1 Tax=Synechocystis sp. LEGE 06083 TaxID=915336 RepID=UPI001882701F|nr:hypothetical protein [Synechocystis sp. LEGE 06083]MBE9196422.1 hypothetical protein [Synechocystis sp. LEGE 06083]
MNFNSDSEVSHQGSQPNSLFLLSLEDFEDLQDLRRAKQEQEGEPTYTLEEVKAMLDDSSP